ncbi:hypothetical protein L228DRAFT_266602 [Xylona heveae TC161]|uniref:Uncharacterized protein n=1 Tax=Xylona heveae (strain CBS 132557 / TC161) TaxID=1328760 RepID=A0A165I254_XYLHT|nr:hypothetical protein L228DRAFT_266602 [Xylona heveae TC161]KZF24254.1 hypothetical protein L228DRAFT_266602 [Xylona heveae TC161]
MEQLSPAEEKEIGLFQRQYAQLLPVQTLAFPRPESLRKYSFQNCIYNEMFNREIIKFPPPDRYQLRVLKELVARIEKAIVDPAEDEVLDDLMSCLTEFLCSPLPSEIESAQQKAHVAYALPTPSEVAEKSQNVTLLESRSLISSSGTTGLRTWEAALRLGTFFSLPSSRHLIEGKTVLELGAGTGFLSILCSKYLSAKHVTATDGDEGVVESIKINASLNGINDSKTLDSHVLRWGKPWEETILDDNVDERQYDVAIGADITYDGSVIPFLVSTLRDLFKRFPKLQFIISATIRNETTFKGFLEACENHKFHIQELNLNVPPMEEQTGFFHPTSTPIRIFAVTCSEPPKDHLAT